MLFTIIATESTVRERLTNEFPPSPGHPGDAQVREEIENLVNMVENHGDKLIYSTVLDLELIIEE